METLAILIPVLDRPESAALVADSIRSNTIRDAEILFLCSPDDLDEIHACEETGERTVVVDWPAGHGDYARKINAGYLLTETDWIFTAADDLDFHAAWDRAIDRAEGAAVIGTQDLCNPAVKAGRHSTHTLVARSYVGGLGATYTDGPGVVLHEGYAHQWVDSELVDAARARGVWRFDRDAIVKHLHPICGENEMDETYRKAMGLGASRQEALHDRRLWQRRRNDFMRTQRRGGRR